jgi:hypothetical protein
MSFGLKISFGRLCRVEELDQRVNHRGHRSFSDEMKRMDDEAKDSKEWHYTQRSGWTIYKKPAVAMTKRQLLDERQWPRNAEGEPSVHIPLKSNEIQEGMEVVVKNTLADYLWGLMTVSRNSYGQYQLVNEYIGVSIGIAEDDRDCWVSYGIFNLRAIQKVLSLK